MTVATHCEVCNRALSPRGRRVTGLCYACIRDGAAFAHAWMADLAGQGLAPRAIGDVVGSSPAVVRARLSEFERGIA